MSKKTVLVTGASRGIGKAIAVKYAKKGYNVAVNCIHSEERLAQTRREIESYQTECLAFLGTWEIPRTARPFSKKSASSSAEWTFS